MQLLANALIAGSFAALLAGGLALVYGTLGVFNLALGQLALIGGYSAWWLLSVLGLPLSVSIVGGVTIGALCTWLSFELVIGPFYRHHRFLPLVTTIALSMIIDGLLILMFGESPKSMSVDLRQTVNLLGAIVNVQQIVLVLSMAALLSGVAWILHSTPLGRRIRATAEHPDAARSIGISSSFLHRMIFIGSGILASLGGIYIALDQNITPTLAFPLTIKAYAAVIAGGRGNLWGAVLCAYLLSAIEQLAVGIPLPGGIYIPAGYQSIVALFIIILLLLVRPSGLFSSHKRIA